MKNIELYDLKSKELLMDINVISNIMHYCIPEFKDVKKEDIKNYLDVNKDLKLINTMSNEDIKVKDALIKYDILFTSKVPNSSEKIGLFINIEAQNDTSPGYSLLKRSIYYASRLISRQKGETFNNSDFDSLKKIYSIWICPLPRKNMKNTINLYNLNEECIEGNYHTSEDYKLINIIFINLGDDYRETKNNVIKMLSLLFRTNNLKAEDKIKMLKNDYGILKEEKEVSYMCSLGEGIYLKGKTEGKIEGKIEGMLEGKIEGKLNTVLELIKNNIISKEDAFKFIGDDKDLLDAVRSQLNS